MTDREGAAVTASETPWTAGDAIARIADVSNIMGWQAGEPGAEIAGGIVSFLAAHPEHIDRFIRDPDSVMMDGTFDPYVGCLTWRTSSGEIINRQTYEERLALHRANPALSAGPTGGVEE